MPKVFYQGLTVFLAMLLSGGCASVMRTSPQAPSRVNIKLKNSDYTVMGTVKGVSTTTSYVGGIVKVVDGEKVRVLGIKFFCDQYSYLRPQEPLSTKELVLSIYFLPIGAPWLAYRAYQHTPSAEDRAYCKMLTKIPEADALVNPSWRIQRSGFPLIQSEEEVTVTAKAIKYRSDNQ